MELFAPQGKTTTPPAGGGKGVRSPAGAADKIAEFCGTLHQAQLSSVYYALSQSALVPLNRGLLPYGVNSTEHAPVTYTLDKNADTGDITIRYSEPDGFSIRFSWQTVVHLDGSTESTPLAAEVPPDFAARRQGASYAHLGGLPPEAPFTPSTMVSGNGPASTAVRNLVETPSGAPADATPTEKATSFANRLNAHAAKEMAVGFATVASKNLVAGQGPNAHVDVTQDHAQLKRDLAGGYRYHFPGGQAPTNNYNEIRDRFVRFLTRRNNSTYAEASEAVKKRVAVLMSLATQYTCTVGVNGVPTSMALPGGNPLTYMLLTQGGTGVDFKFARAPDGNIRLTVNSRYNAQMLVLNNDDAPAQHRLPAGSTYAFQMTITLPEDNLDELADADWAHYDRKALTDFEAPIDDRVNLIPPACRFKGTVDLVFHLHEAPAPAPAP